MTTDEPISPWRLTLKMALLLYVVGHVLILAHEIGHGTAAMLLGGYFPFLQIDAEGGRSIYMFPFGSPAWKQAIVMLGGAIANSLVAIVMFAYIALTSSKGERRLVATIAGGLSALLLVTGSGIFPFWEVGYKEIGQAFVFLAMPAFLHPVFKIVWMLFGVALAAIFFRWFFDIIQESLPSRTYLEKLKLVTLALALPSVIVMAALSAVMLAAGYGEGVITVSRHTPHIIFLITAYLLLPLVVPSAPAARDKRPLSVPRRQLVGYAAATVLFAAVQLSVFGNNREDPRGLFLSRRPPEVDVAACNVAVKVDRDLRAHVRFLVRPYVYQHAFLWRRARNYEPEDWSHYERFVKSVLPRMLGVQDYRIVDRRSDPDAAFYNNGWSEGARLVEAEVDLSGSKNIRSEGDHSVLHFVDAWRARAIGYFDAVSISFDDGVETLEVTSEPSRAERPKREPREIHWENVGYGESPRSVTIGFRVPVQQASSD